MALHFDNPRRPAALGQIDPGVEIGATTMPLSPFVFFLVAVAAGITTWYVTSKLSSRR